MSLAGGIPAYYKRNSELRGKLGKGQDQLQKFKPRGARSALGKASTDQDQRLYRGDAENTEKTKIKIKGCNHGEHGEKII